MKKAVQKKSTKKFAAPSPILLAIGAIASAIYLMRMSTLNNEDQHVLGLTANGTPQEQENVEVVNQGGNTELKIREQNQNEQSVQVQDKSKIELQKENGKTKVNIKVGDMEREMEVTDQNGEVPLLKISNKNQDAASEVKVESKGDKFNLKQGDLSAETTLPISIDPKTSAVSVTTPSGNVLLKTLPTVAVNNILKSGAVDKVGTIKIETLGNSASTSGTVVITAQGTKTGKLLGLFKVTIPVTIKVDTSTGKEISKEEPILYKILPVSF